MQQYTYEKDGFAIRNSEKVPDGSDNLEIGCQVKLNFALHVGGGFGENAFTEDEEMFLEVLRRGEDGSYVGKLCGICMCSDKIKPNQDINFSAVHVASIKSKETIEKEKQMFGRFVKKHHVVEKEREEYYENLEKKKKEEEERAKEEAAKFMESGGFFFGSDDIGGDASKGGEKEEDEKATGEKRKRDSEELKSKHESPMKKRKLD